MAEAKVIKEESYISVERVGEYSNPSVVELSSGTYTVEMKITVKNVGDSSGKIIISAEREVGGDIYVETLKEINNPEPNKKYVAIAKVELTINWDKLYSKGVNGIQYRLNGCYDDKCDKYGDWILVEPFGTDIILRAVATIAVVGAVGYTIGYAVGTR